MSQVTIFPVTDLDLVAKIDRQIFPEDPPVELKDTKWWVAFRGRRPVGFCGIALREEGKTGYMTRAGVVAGARRQGIHKRLIRVRLRWARQMKLSHVVTYTVSGNCGSSNNLIRAGFELYNPKEPWAGRSDLYWIKSLAS